MASSCSTEPAAPARSGRAAPLRGSGVAPLRGSGAAPLVAFLLAPLLVLPCLAGAPALAQIRPPQDSAASGFQPPVAQATPPGIPGRVPGVGIPTPPVAPARPPGGQVGGVQPPGQVGGVQPPGQAVPGGAPRPVPAGMPPVLEPADGALRQAAGDYPAMARPLPDPLVPLDQIQGSWTDPIAAPGQVAPGVLRVTWRRDQVVAVRVRQFMAVPITLPPCEQVDRVVLGDSWVFKAEVPAVPRRNVVVVHAGLVGADTNMSVLTRAGRAYSFYVRSEGVQTSDITDLAVFVDAPRLCEGEALEAGTGFRAGLVPASSSGGSGPWESRAPAGAGPAGSGDYVRGVPESLGQLDFDSLKAYAASEDDRQIGPDRVFTDGLWTYLYYGPESDGVPRGVAHAVIDGVPSRVNTRVIGDRSNILVIEAVADVMTLTSGRRVICIRRTKPLRAPGAVVVDADLGRPRSGWFSGWLDFLSPGAPVQGARGQGRRSDAAALDEAAQRAGQSRPRAAQPRWPSGDGS